MVAWFEESVLFGAGLPEAAERRLNEAVSLRVSQPDRAEALLLEARERAGHCLPTHFALYKFYANRKDLAKAEAAARAALDEAARQGGFAPDWRALPASFAGGGLYASEAGLFYLFSLKALAFIGLRRGQLDQSAEILRALAALDPEDRVGGSVTRSLLASVQPPEPA